MEDGSREIRFDWTETATRLQALMDDVRLVSDDKGRAFIGEPYDDPRVIFRPPPMQPLRDMEPEAYLEAVRQGPGRQLMVIMQAGATALGLWEEADLIRHKVIKKYVTRGKGKAQTTYLKTRGKSRYGSRLRLQNAKEHLVETNERMTQWWQEYGPCDLILYSCPVRMWAEVFKTRPAPPFPKDGPVVKIPMDVRVPGHEELLRVRRFAGMGTIWFKNPEVDS